MTICQKVCFSSGIKSRTDSGLTSVTNMSHVGEILKDSLKNGKIRFSQCDNRLEKVDELTSYITKIVRFGVSVCTFLHTFVHISL